MVTRNREDLTIGPNDAIRLAMQRIDRNQCGIALVVDEQGRLLSTVTDGDIRRAILAGVGIDLSVSRLLERKTSRRPISAPVGTPRSALLATMRASMIQQIPILDAQQRVVDLVTISDLNAAAGAAGTATPPPSTAPRSTKSLLSLSE